jgi:DNA-binding response OmpR family regulator
MTLPTLMLVEEDLAKMVAIMLRKSAVVVHARNGQEALALIQRGPLPNAIITDRAMPTMDGLQFVKQLKRDALFKRTPVMMLTAMDDTRSTVEGINAGVKHYVAKPFRAVDLIGKVEKLLATSPITSGEHAPAAKASFKAPSRDAVATPAVTSRAELLDQAMALVDERLAEFDLEELNFDELEIDEARSAEAPQARAYATPATVISLCTQGD